jgi:putative two-component system response regulator
MSELPLPKTETTDAPNATRVLVVDDDETVAKFLRRALTLRGYTVETVPDGDAALRVLRERPADVVLLDVVLPGMNGYEICTRLKHDPETRLLPVVLITGMVERERRIQGVEAGADDFLTKPIDLHELLARVASLARIKRYTDDLDSVTAIITMLATMIEARDGYTTGHCHRMANFASALGRRLALPDHDVQALHRGGFLHDIGMLAIPESVLRKEARLTSEEFEIIKSHTVIGDSLCANLRSLEGVRPIVRHHHERRDGSGYPDGLTGDHIPLTAQIMGIVDVYDAMTSRRPYQDARPVDEAIDTLRKQVVIGWRSHELVEEFATMIRSAGRDARAHDLAQC